MSQPDLNATQKWRDSSSVCWQVGQEPSHQRRGSHRGLQHSNERIAVDRLHNLWQTRSLQQMYYSATLGLQLSCRMVGKSEITTILNMIDRGRSFVRCGTNRPEGVGLRKRSQHGLQCEGVATCQVYSALHLYLLCAHHQGRPASTSLGSRCQAHDAAHTRLAGSHKGHAVHGGLHNSLHGSC